MRWFMHSCRKAVSGDASGCAGEPALLSCHRCSVFPARRGKQMIVMSFSDVMNVLFMYRVGGISGEHA